MRATRSSVVARSPRRLRRLARAAYTRRMDMDDIVFDALAASQELREAGVEDRQAEAIAAAIRRAAAAGREGLATKADLDVLGAHVDSSLASTRSDLGSGFASIRSELNSGLAGLRADIAAWEARICRALWIQGAGIVAVMTGFVSIAAVLGMFG